MAYFAELDDKNMVLRVLSISNSEITDKNGVESEEIGIKYCMQHFDGRWLQCSYNSKIRKNYPGAGFLYDSELDAFIPPQPFKSWVLDKETCSWMAPVPKPDDDKNYFWDENNLSWVRIS